MLGESFCCADGILGAPRRWRGEGSGTVEVGRDMLCAVMLCSAGLLGGYSSIYLPTHLPS